MEYFLLGVLAVAVFYGALMLCVGMLNLARSIQRSFPWFRWW